MSNAASQGATLRSLKDLRGFTIAATDGDIGSVKEFYFDDLSYTVRHVVVDTGGWLSGRKVLVSPIAFRAIDWEHKRINAELTKAQVREGPDIDTDKPVSRQHEASYYGYYGYTPYWTGSHLWGAYPYPYLGPEPAMSTVELERERRWTWGDGRQNDHHLRSSRAVTGYHVQATDGDIGHVKDFLVDDRSWAIRYMIVDTTNWWAGKQVLVAPGWIQNVDWSHSQVQVNLTRERVKASPAYDSSRPVERAYETHLYGHYGRPHDWVEHGGKAV